MTKTGRLCRPFGALERLVLFSGGLRLRLTHCRPFGTGLEACPATLRFGTGLEACPATLRFGTECPAGLRFAGRSAPVVN